jgi:hypothetical protein
MVLNLDSDVQIRHNKMSALWTPAVHHTATCMYMYMHVIIAYEQIYTHNI